MEIGFIILHYKDIESTYKCVESIGSLECPNNCAIRVVIVDNGSQNGTGEKLHESYFGNKQVDTIISNKNLGFARGNNLGVSYYINNYNRPDYLVVCNNDIIINNKHFIYKVDEIYNNTSFNVLGPDVFNPITSEHQSPCGSGVTTLTGVDRMLANCCRQLEKYRSPSICNRFEFAVRDSAIFRMLTVVKHRLGLFEQDRHWDEAQEGVVLQGSFLVFDRIFLEKMQQPFIPVTFMYFEEFFLHLCTIKNNLKTMYSPDVQVLHMHGVSTSVDCAKWSRRQLFYYENLLDSLSEYKKLLKEYIQSTYL